MARSALRRPALAAAAFIGLSALYYFASWHAFSGNSDTATVVLEGASIRGGHLALHHWSLSLDSFWTVDALFYAVAVLIEGVRASAMHLVPAVLAAATVVTGGVVITRGERPRSQLVALAVLAALVVLPSHALSFFLLQGPWHVGSVLYCLIAMALLTRDDFDLRWWIAVVLLALGLLGDLQVVALGVVPVLLAGVAAMARTGSYRRGRTTAAAAPAAVLLAVLGRVIALAVGTFHLASSKRGTTLTQIRGDASLFVNWLGALLGVHRGPFGGPRLSLWLELPHLLAVAAIAAGVIAAAVGLVRGVLTPHAAVAPEDAARLLDDLLLFGFLGAVAVFVELTATNNPAYGRYLDAVVLFGALLAARFLGRLSLGLGREALAAGALGLSLLFASSAATLSSELSSRVPRSTTAALEHFLAGKGLHQGIGDYWASSIVTVDTGGKILVRPVVATAAGRVVAYGRQATSDWYSAKSFGFLVYASQPFGGVEPSTIKQTFGAPLHTYRVGGYSVDVWSHPLRLGSTTSG